MKRHNHKPMWKHWRLTTSKWDTHCPPLRRVSVPVVAASPAAPGPSPSLASVVSDVVPGGEDLPDIVDGTDLDSAPATGFQGVAKMDEETEDMQQQQLPRQIHIKQHLKLHFHPQGTRKKKNHPFTYSHSRLNIKRWHKSLTLNPFCDELTQWQLRFFQPYIKYDFGEELTHLL